MYSIEIEVGLLSVLYLLLFLGDFLDHRMIIVLLVYSNLDTLYLEI